MLRSWIIPKKKRHQTGASILMYATESKVVPLLYITRLEKMYINEEAEKILQGTCIKEVFKTPTFLSEYLTLDYFHLCGYGSFY